MATLLEPLSASALAEVAIQDLATRFPAKVQIHLHPSTSLPATLVGSLGDAQHDSSLSPAASSPSSSSTVLPVALVWTVPSLKLLRSYGLTGSFTGTLAQFPQQNIFLGLPIQLLPEEVVYLLRRCKAVVVDEGSSYRKATEGETEGVNSVVEEDRRGQQLEAWHERQALRAKHAKNPLPESTPTPKEVEALPWHYTIPTTSSSSSTPWFHPVTYTTLSSIQPLYPFPSTTREVASVGLFEHFKEQNQWCMNGLRFGGAFAVYPGDPLRYHSHYTAQLVVGPEDVSLMELVANGRLGTAVKKTHLLCHARSLHPLLELSNEGGGKRGSKALRSIAEGLFDTAPMEAKAAEDNEEQDGERRQNGKRLAEFEVFSLAWAGFGT